MNAFETDLQAGLKAGRFAVRWGGADEEMNATLTVQSIAPKAGAAFVVGPARGARPQAFCLEVYGNEAVGSGQTDVPGVAVGWETDEANVLLSRAMKCATNPNVRPVRKKLAVDALPRRALPNVGGDLPMGIGGSENVVEGVASPVERFAQQGHHPKVEKADVKVRRHSEAEEGCQ